MNVPFVSSGAMSRAHYALVRNVETAASPQEADQILLNELDVIRRSLEKQHLSIKVCKESLIILLYCAMSLSTTGPGDLEFAFPHAVNMAELGRSLMDKKLGYIFCMELMPPNHELQLMLVNTLRKDLESTSVPRICLALDVLTQSSNSDVIPAVDGRLQSLLQHKSVAVQRRAFMAYYTLFQGDIESLSRLEEVVERCLRVGSSGAGPALMVTRKLKHSERLERLLNSHIQRQCRESGDSGSVIGILRTLRRGQMKLESRNVSIVLDIIGRHSKDSIRDVVVTSLEHDLTVLRDAFALLSTVPPATLRESQLSSSAVDSIRYLLTSNDPNDQYLFVSCLSCVDPSIWAGTLPETVAILGEWEVQAIMRLLESRDGLIRKTTLKLLHSVDPAIVETYYSQSLLNFSPSFSLSDKNDRVSHLLDIIDIQYTDDVDQYAKHLKDLFSAVEGQEQGSTEYIPVLEPSVERVLTGIRSRETSSRISCITALAVSLTESEVRVGPTLMVIISAVVCEYCGKLSVSPLDILRGTATRLASYSASVQDACLLMMLRLSVECDQVPEEVIVMVQKLVHSGSIHVRKRCDQFLTLSTQRRVLTEIVSKASSSSLPDFLVALMNYQSSPAAIPLGSPRSIPPKRPDSFDLSPAGRAMSPRRLRYEAYAAPQPVPSLRYFSSPRRSKGSVSSPESISRSLSRTSETSQSLNELTRTITPGELTLAAAQSPFYVQEETNRISEHERRAPESDIASRVDLIALDSPFVAEPPKDLPADPDFQARWDSMENANVRGWCEASLDMIVRLLQSLQYRMRVIAVDQPPFEGELKVLILGSSPQQYATLRLREGDDESCLWRLRCDDVELRTSIKRLLEDI